MGLRARLKRKAKSLLGREASSPPVPQSRPAAVRGAAASSPPSAGAAQQSRAPEPKPAAPVSEEDAAKQAKIDKHMRRTRRGVLQFVIDAGGTASLGDMHQHSETRFFVGHKKFSDLMESMVADAQLIYDSGSGEATVTDEGRRWVEDQR